MDNDLLKEILTEINNIRKLQSTWLDLHEAALYLKISESFLYKLIASGSVPHRRIGAGNKSKILFSRKILDYWIIYSKTSHFTKREREQAEAWV